MAEKTTNWQTFILLVKGNIGPGCLALPFCFSMLGPIASLGFVLFIGFFCVYNMWVLVRCKRKIPLVKTYGELASATLGRYGETIVEFFLALMQLSICCVYFSFIGDSLEPMLGIHQSTITILLIIPVLILTSLRHMSELAPLSMIASASLCVALFLILSASVSRFLDNLDPDIPIFRSDKIIPFFVSTIYAYEGIGIILPIEDAMQTPEHFPVVLGVALTLVTIVYITLAETVILTFGYVNDAGITGFLLREGSLSTQTASAISCLISAAVLLSYPLQLYPALQVIEAYCGFKRDHSESSLLCCRSLRSQVPQSPQYTRHTNSMDPTCHSLSSNNSITEENSPFFLEMSEKNDLQRKIIPEHSEDRDRPSRPFEELEYPVFDIPSRFPRSSVRIALVLFTSLVSTLVPNVGLLVSLAGASSGAALSLIFPPLLDLTLCHKRKEEITFCGLSLHLLSIGLGVLAAVLGTVVSLLEIARSLTSN